MWSRCREEDIEFAHFCKPDVLSLSIPVSDVLLLEKLRRNRQWVLDRIVQCVSYALKLGFESVRLGMEDAVRADLDFLLHAVGTACGAGVACIRLADTVGTASPLMVAELIGKAAKKSTVPLGFHSHNDFGMATANAITALESGAQSVDATVLGIGERAGNCRLEELVGYLCLQKGIEHYRPERLRSLCDSVAEAANVSISPLHPLVGEKIFTCDTGLHVQGLLMNPVTYEPYDPVRIGCDRTLLFGGKTGRRAVQMKLESLGVSLTVEEADLLVREIRLMVKSGARPLAEKDLVRLAGRGIA